MQNNFFLINNFSRHTFQLFLNCSTIRILTRQKLFNLYQYVQFEINLCIIQNLLKSSMAVESNMDPRIWVTDDMKTVISWLGSYVNFSWKKKFFFFFQNSKKYF